MKIKNLFTLAFVLAGVLFFTENLNAQKLISGGEPKEKLIEGFDNAYCVQLSAGFQVCKAVKYDAEDTKFVILKESKVLATANAIDYNAACCGLADFFAYRGDLDKDGVPEIVIAESAGISNGMGITTYQIKIFRDPVKFPSQKPLSFPIEEFGEDGNFIFDKRKNETLILVTYWKWYENLDPKRGYGIYLVGKWFYYKSGLLKPALDKPTLARRFLNSFARDRVSPSDNPKTPYLWLKSKNTHRFFVEPKEKIKLIETKFGKVTNFAENNDEYDLLVQTKSGEVLKFIFGCCSEESKKMNIININEFGILPQHFIFPNHFSDGFNLQSIWQKVEDKKVKVEIYDADYIKYAKLWFLEK